MTVAESVVHLKVGGSYKIVLHESDGSQYIARGIYKEIQKPSLAVFSWMGEDSDQRASQVTLQLLDTLDGTEVRLVHEQLESTEIRDHHINTWEKRLNNLQGIL